MFIGRSLALLGHMPGNYCGTLLGNVLTVFPESGPIARRHGEKPFCRMRSSHQDCPKLCSLHHFFILLLTSLRVLCFERWLSLFYIFRKMSHFNKSLRIHLQCEQCKHFYTQFQVCYSETPEIILHFTIRNHFICARKAGNCKPAIPAFIKAKSFSGFTCKIRIDGISFSIYVVNSNVIYNISQQLANPSLEKRVYQMKISFSIKSKIMKR